MHEPARLARLARSAVSRMQLGLNGQRVHTEAASGPFAATALVAALAGASEVVAVTRDSRWGRATETIARGRELAERLGVAGTIRYEEGEAARFAEGCDVVTNLGFVRPIDAALISRLSPRACIALMWEPWEFRPEDIDLAASRQYGVPVIGTAETHPQVRTFEYIGPTVGRLLLESGIEILGSKLLLSGSDPFGAATEKWLTGAGAEVCRASADEWAGVVESGGLAVSGAPLDAVVIVEHRLHQEIIGARHAAALEILSASGTPVIRVCGGVDHAALRERGVTLVPDTQVSSGYMAVTTAYAGSRPVVDLHAAGLKAASTVVRARSAGASIQEAILVAVRSGYGLALEGGC